MIAYSSTHLWVGASLLVLWFIRWWIINLSTAATSWVISGFTVYVGIFTLDSIVSMSRVSCRLSVNESVFTLLFVCVNRWCLIISWSCLRTAATTHGPLIFGSSSYDLKTEQQNIISASIKNQNINFRNSPRIHTYGSAQIFGTFAASRLLISKLANFA